MKILITLVAALLIQAPDSTPYDRVMNAVRNAVAPALPFPGTDDSGSLPAHGETEPAWMVRPWQAGDTAIEILVNPLNQVNQVRATQAMRDIERNIAAAQAKAESQYERALAEAKRSGTSQDVDGVTLTDEGVEGEKIDAESHVTIDVLFNQPEYHLEIRGRIEPGPMLAGGPTHVDVVAHTYKEHPKNGPEHYKETERIMFLGPMTTPVAKMREASPVFDVVAKPTAGTPTLVVRIRGNKDLVNEIAARTNWNQLVELLK